jgi:hypothetical protein
MQYLGKDLAEMGSDEIRFKLFLLYLFRVNAKRINSAWQQAGSPGPDDTAGWESIRQATHPPDYLIGELRDRMRYRESWGFHDAPYPAFQLTNASSTMERLRDWLERRELGTPGRFSAGKEALEFAKKCISTTRAEQLRQLLPSQGVFRSDKPPIPAASTEEDVAIRAVWATIPSGSSSWSTALEVLCDYLQQKPQQELTNGTVS